MKLLAIDFGERRIGIAVGHAETKMAFPRPWIDTQTQNTFAEIQKIIKEERIQSIVVGYPLRTDGKESEKAKSVDEFIFELQTHVTLPIHRQDESFSSVVAKEKTAHYSTKKKKTEKGRIDSAAAAIFLQDYLETL
jgi:putative Holliday junction resolvase